MDNFSILLSKEYHFDTDDFYFEDKEAYIYPASNISDEKPPVPDATIKYRYILQTGTGKLALPFAVSIFKNLQYDYLILSTDKRLYRINKHKKEIDEIGMLHDEVVGIFPCDDFFLVLTNKELLLFNTYFELSVCIEIGESVSKFKASRKPETTVAKESCRCGNEAALTCPDGGQVHCTDPEDTRYFKAVWADDLICLIGTNETIIYDLKLSIINIWNENVKDAVFISKYNKFACVVGDAIKFIEPNGLEHGEPLDFKAEHIQSIEIDGEQLLVASSGESALPSQSSTIDDKLKMLGVNNSAAGASISLFYMKNFHFYKKIVLRKSMLLKAVDNMIITRAPGVVKVHYVYREMTSGLVIDGSALKYTDLSAALIPPPLFYKQIDIGSMCNVPCHPQVEAVCVESHSDRDSSDQDTKSIYILSNFIIRKYKKDKKNIYYDSEIDIRKIIDMRFDDSQIINEMIVVRNEGHSILLVRTGNHVYPIIVSKDPKLHPRFEETDIVPSSTDDVVKLIKIEDGYGLLFESGLLLYKNSLFADTFTECKFAFNISKNFKIEVNRECVVFLNDGNLQIKRLHGNSSCAGESLESSNTHIIPFVFSFIAYDRYIIYVYKNILEIISEGAVCYTAYIDAATHLIAVLNGRIVSQTRFGSLETTTCKVFARRRVEKALKEGEYRLAADICDSERVDYSIFYNDGVCPIAAVKSLKDSQIVSLLGFLKFPNSVFHENDSLERIRNISLQDGCRALLHYELPVKSLNPGLFIRERLVQRFFETEYHPKLFDIEAAIASAGKKVSGYELPCSLSDRAFDCAEPLDHIILADPIGSVNAVLPFLSFERHPNSIVSIFSAMNRIDFCFFLPDLPRVISILKSIFSTHDIVKAATTTLCLSKISLAYSLCQLDYAPFRASFKTHSNLGFALFDHLEDRKKALYYLVREWIESEDPTGRIFDAPEEADGTSITKRIASYVEQYELFNELVMYQYYGIFDANFYCYAAKHLPIKQALLLSFLGGDKDGALDIAKEHLLWKEAIALFTVYYDKESLGKEPLLRIYEDFTKGLIANNRFTEAATIQEVYIKDFKQAVENYVLGNSYGKAIGLYQRAYSAKTDSAEYNTLSTLLIDSARDCLRNQTAELSHLVKTYDDHKHRLCSIQERLANNIGLSQSTFSCTSAKSLKNALTKDRPGGLFEYEYVQNKIRKVVLEIVALQEKAVELNGIFEHFAMVECVEAQNLSFKDIRKRLRKEIDDIWNYKRDDVDTKSSINIIKPTLGYFFE